MTWPRRSELAKEDDAFADELPALEEPVSTERRRSCVAC